MSSRVYKFNWKFIGNIDAGRPTLGCTTRLEMYRLLQYTLRDVLESRLGTDETDTLFYKAGFLAGSEFCRQFLSLTLPLNEFLQQLKKTLLDFGVGVLDVDNVTIEDDGVTKLQMVLNEDLDCSGLPNIEHATCSYDEGFIAGILKTYSGSNFRVKEVACWCLGNEYCRFEAEIL